MPVPASFMSGLNQLGTQVVYGHQQLPGTYAAASSPPGQRLRNLARQEHDAHEAAARASAYGYHPPGSQRPASHRGPAPPKPMQAIMAGLDNELRFEDPQVKVLLHEIFQIPAFTQQLFSFPVHSKYQRRTYFGHPCKLLPDLAQGIVDNALNPGSGNPYKDVFDLPPSNEPERVGYRIIQAIDLYKDAWCYDRDHQSVPVLARPETECKARVDEWVRHKLVLLNARTLPEQAQQAVYQAPVQPPVQAPPVQQAPAYQTTPQQTIVTPAVEASPAKPVSHPPYGNRLYPPTSSASTTLFSGEEVVGASMGAGPSSVARDRDIERLAAEADAAAAAKAELEQLAAAEQSTAQLHAAMAEGHLRAAAALGV